MGLICFIALPNRGHDELNPRDLDEPGPPEVTGNRPLAEKRGCPLPGLWHSRGPFALAIGRSGRIHPPGQSIPLSLAITLLTVAGNVGANLIAEQLQRWRDQARPVTEPEVVTWVQEQVATKDELRQALDQLLETFQAIPEGQNSLSEDDKNWFSEKLQRELARLGNLPRFRATL